MKSVQEREAETRARALQVFEALCPGVAGNPFIPHFPTVRQQAFLGAHVHEQHGKVFEALYGGAAGGGKSDALLMSVAQFAWKHGEFAAACFRRTNQDLINPGALLDRAHEWWNKTNGVEWHGGKSIFVFPSGAKVKMGHMSQPDAHLDHQGAEYHQTVWDELTQHPTDKQYRYVGLSRVRRKAGSAIPLRTLSGSNPGGPGHIWVKKRFVGGSDAITGEIIRPEHVFVSAKIADNPHLDQEQYIESLMLLHPTLRDQLLKGDWDAREPGDYFRVSWFGPLLDLLEEPLPREKVSVRWWDLAASERETAARTAGVKMTRLRPGVRVIEHAVAFRATPGSRDDRIVQQAQIDGRSCVVGIEIEPGSGGPAQFQALERRLKAAGYRVAGARPRVELSKQEGQLILRQPGAERGKMGRADPVASCLERGHQRRGECNDTGGNWWGLDIERPLSQQKDGLRLVAGAWTQEYLDEIEGFPDADLKDFVDATSGAWAYLEAHPFGLRTPFPNRKPPVPAELHNIHPADRPDPVDMHRTASGLFRP